MSQLLLHLPDDLVRRFRRMVAPRQRSKFIQRLLEDALMQQDGRDDDPLYQAALAVEANTDLATEMAEWEEATLEDGLTSRNAEGKKPK